MGEVLGVGGSQPCPFEPKNAFGPGPNSFHNSAGLGRAPNLLTCQCSGPLGSELIVNLKAAKSTLGQGARRATVRLLLCKLALDAFDNHKDPQNRTL
jgi:hypothetical protein